MAKKHTDTIQKMLDMIAAQPGIRTAALADAFEISTNEVRGRLQTVIDAGLVVVCVVKQPTGHPQNEFRISATAPCADGKAPDWSAIKAARRRERYASDTPAGGGDVSPAAIDGSLPCDHLDQAMAVAPPKPAKPVEAGADVKRISINTRTGRVEFDGRIGSFSDLLDPEDDTDEPAYARARRMIFDCSSDGIVNIHRRGETGLTLNPGEANDLYELLHATRRFREAA